MKWQIGYQANKTLVSYLIQYKEFVSEIYFPWMDLATGRGVISSEAQDTLAADLQEFRSAGIKLTLLLNGNCYGWQSLSGEFYQKLKQNISYLINEYSISGVTTTSPLIAAMIRKNFPGIEIRASVNMEIGTPEGIEYLLDDFDSFYLKREYNYNKEVILRMRDFCRSNGKKLYILANSGCLNFCSARTFHDNLVAHQHEIDHAGSVIAYQGQCTRYLISGNNRENLLAKTNFIRPEDVHLYENLCDGMKLATRTNFNPMAIVHAYFNGKFRGNLLDLTEPAHSAVLPGQIIANKLIPDDYTEFRLNCNKICENCNYCKDVQKKATITL